MRPILECLDDTDPYEAEFSLNLQTSREAIGTVRVLQRQLMNELNELKEVRRSLQPLSASSTSLRGEHTSTLTPKTSSRQVTIRPR
ncbi:MAG TPA: hypothetical protein V6C84_00760 [Coleofasciculaceae cyanobacterium]|jgi:hypothetical protein